MDEILNHKFAKYIIYTLAISTVCGRFFGRNDKQYNALQQQNNYDREIPFAHGQYQVADVLDELEKDIREAASPVGDIREIALYSHNVVRNNHVGTPPLTWDNGLAADAQAYALELVNSGRFDHASTLEGENLYQGQSGRVMGFEIAAFLWYEEINQFNYGQMWRVNLYGPKGTGHFTQMVWASTREVGCAGAHKPWINGMIQTVYVCRYNPAGNVPSQYDNNVKPLKPGAFIPTNPMMFIPRSGTDTSEVEKCKDTNPGYCGQMTRSMCYDASFGPFNKKTCPKTCNKC